MEEATTPEQRRHMPPRLVLNAALKSQIPEVREHLLKALTDMQKPENPIAGYAIVAFHDNEVISAGYHLTRTEVKEVDLPQAAFDALLFCTKRKA